MTRKFTFGSTSDTLTGNKLPVNGEQLSTFYNHQDMNHHDMRNTIMEWTALVIRDALSFLKRAMFPTRLNDQVSKNWLSLFEV